MKNEHRINTSCWVCAYFSKMFRTKYHIYQTISKSLFFFSLAGPATYHLEQLIYVCFVLFMTHFLTIVLNVNLQWQTWTKDSTLATRKAKKEKGQSWRKDATEGSLNNGSPLRGSYTVPLCLQVLVTAKEVNINDFAGGPPCCNDFNKHNGLSMTQDLLQVSAPLCSA